jgi:hypothetical protein
MRPQPFPWHVAARHAHYIERSVRANTHFLQEVCTVPPLMREEWEWRWRSEATAKVCTTNTPCNLCGGDGSSHGDASSDPLP